MLHVAVHLITSIPVQSQTMLHAMPQHLSMWQQSLPASVTARLEQPDTISGVTAPQDWKPYNNTFTPNTGGCVDSPEAATLVLMAVGLIGVAMGGWIARQGAKKSQIVRTANG